MRERHYFQCVAEVNKDNAVRKGVDRHAPDGTITKVWHRASYLRKLLDQMQSLTGLFRKSICNAWISLSVPGSRFTELCPSRPDDPQRFQRPSTSLSTSSSTIRQSVLSRSPARTAATLLRISLAQASSTPSSASLKLSSSSAAIFARSSRGSSNTCFNSWFACGMT
ncbi:MAG: hypothetical protein QOC81_1958 [Thermoanaerobaculia bacterium]|nr:hypothetical protein [Thermoanaerobaculia bacterium]